jgi:hypothetical protein
VQFGSVWVSLDLSDKIKLAVLSKNYSGIQKNLGQATKLIIFGLKIQNLRVTDFPIKTSLFKKPYLRNQAINLLENSFLLFRMHFSSINIIITLTQKTFFSVILIHFQNTCTFWTLFWEKVDKTKTTASNFKFEDSNDAKFCLA